VLLLDAGDVISGSEEYARIKADFASKALPGMGYDAVGMGEMEARYVKELQSRKPYGDIPLISANLTDEKTRKPIGSDQYVIKKTRLGLKVGIISVLAPFLVDVSLQQRAGVSISPAADVLKREFKRLRDRSDLVILLSHGDLDGARRLAQDFPGIDVIIVGHCNSSTIQEKPEQIGTTLLMTTRTSGKYLGKLALDIGADRKIAGYSGEYVPMDATLQDDPEMTKLVAEQDKTIEDYYARMRLQYVRYNPVDSTQPRSPQPFVTATKCRECHLSEYNSWQKTKHQTAFEALRKDKKTADPECISCHTTAFKAKGGFLSEYATPQFKGVQCEVCHGPGVMHSRKPAKGYGAVIQSTCGQCHDRANSPKYDFQVYKALIIHEKGPGAKVVPVAK